MSATVLVISCAPVLLACNFPALTSTLAAGVVGRGLRLMATGGSSLGAGVARGMLRGARACGRLLGPGGWLLALASLSPKARLLDCVLHLLIAADASGCIRNAWIHPIAEAVLGILTIFKH